MKMIFYYRKIHFVQKSNYSELCYTNHFSFFQKRSLQSSCKTKQEEERRRGLCKQVVHPRHIYICFVVQRTSNRECGCQPRLMYFCIINNNELNSQGIPLIVRFILNPYILDNSKIYECSVSISVNFHKVFFHILLYLYIFL